LANAKTESNVLLRLEVRPLGRRLALWKVSPNGSEDVIVGGGNARAVASDARIVILEHFGSKATKEAQ